MESCGMSLIKYLLFAFNIIFCITGVILIVLGGIVLAAANNSSEITGNDTTYVPSIILIVAGIIVFAIAFLGCFGAIRESYFILMTFAGLLLIIFVIELAIGIAVAVNSAEFNSQSLKDSFNANLQTNKDKWEKIQQNFKCCGVDGPNDWGGSFPASCCSGEVSKETDTPNDQCAQFSAETQYLNTDGCFERLRLDLAANKKILIGVGIGIAFVEIVGIVLAIWLATHIRQGSKGGCCF